MPQILSKRRDSLKEHLTQAKTKHKTPNQTKTKKRKQDRIFFQEAYTWQRGSHGSLSQERKVGSEGFRIHCVQGERRRQEPKGIRAVPAKTLSLILVFWWWQKWDEMFQSDHA